MDAECSAILVLSTPATTAHIPAPYVDFLTQALEVARSYLSASLPLAERLRTFWAIAVAARGLAASDVLQADLMWLANESGLRRDLGRHADEDLLHVFRWALLNRNPFE
jgi:hypothetical protein